MHRFLTLLVIALCALPAAVGAQTYPAKAIHWIVSYPAGGGLDFATRTITNDLSARLGQSIVVENKPGASGMIGAAAGAKAPADGYTVLTIDSGGYAVVPFLYRNVAYSPKKDFILVATAVRIPFLWLVTPSVPARTLDEFVKHAKTNPDKISYASTGIGNPLHLMAEMLQQKAGVKLFHVPYKSMPNVATDLASGQVQAAVGDVATFRPFVQSNRVRALAITSTTRNPAFPDVPTFAELGMPDMSNASPWVAFAVPSGTPPAVIERLDRAIGETLAAPETRAKLTGAGMEIFHTPYRQANAFGHAQIDNWESVVRPLNLKLD